MLDGFNFRFLQLFAVKVPIYYFNHGRYKKDIQKLGVFTFGELVGK